MRIASACISHRANTSLPGLTPLSAFSAASPYGAVLVGDEITDALYGANTIHGGFIVAADNQGFELCPVMWAEAAPSAPLSQHAHHALLTLLEDGLRAIGPVDGLLLELDGAMVTEDRDDAELQILRLSRRVLGRRCPIAVTVSFGANLQPELAQEATVLVGRRTYPSVDCAERGYEAAHLLMRSIRGEVRPVTALCRPPMLLRPPVACTWRSPMRELMARTQAIRDRAGVLSVTVCRGCAAADSPHTGVSVAVTTDDDAELADRLARQLGLELWQSRRAFRLDTVSVESAIERAIHTQGGPVVIADLGDDLGSGAPGDDTRILDHLLRRNVWGSVVAPLVDGEVVDACFRAGVGAEVAASVGGKSRSGRSTPLPVRGVVRALQDQRFINEGARRRCQPVNFGRVARLDCHGVEVLLVERASEPSDTALLTQMGVTPQAQRIIVLKSAIEFWPAYESVAADICFVTSEGLDETAKPGLGYHRLRRPIFPLDADVDWSPL